VSTCLCFRNYQCLSCEAGTRPKVSRGTQRKVAQCGTRAGYSRHLKMGEATCTECKAAQTAAVIAYKKKKELVNG
jgi:hypothetical protein